MVKNSLITPRKFLNGIKFMKITGSNPEINEIKELIDL
jgi:hypothetical protein